MKRSNVNKARDLRRRQTEPEKILWRKLRNRAFMGLKFRRQHMVGPYILDFYCPELNLNFDLDGGGHGFAEQQEHDERRTRYLNERGIHTKRIWNSELRSNLDGVLMGLRVLEERLRSESPHPGPLPRGERERGLERGALRYPCRSQRGVAATKEN